MRVTPGAEALPTDPDALRALLLAERERHAQELAAAHGEAERLIAIIKELQRHRFGRRSERVDPDQLALTLEDLEQTVAASEAEAETAEAPKPSISRKRRINRGALPAHLPREEIVIDVADKTCPCCNGLRHRIGESLPSGLTRGMYRSGSTSRRRSSRSWSSAGPSMPAGVARARSRRPRRRSG